MSEKQIFLIFYLSDHVISNPQPAFGLSSVDSWDFIVVLFVSLSVFVTTVIVIIIKFVIVLRCRLFRVVSLQFGLCRLAEIDPLQIQMIVLHRAHAHADVRLTFTNVSASHGLGGSHTGQRHFKLSNYFFFYN
jgi:hypothetical protein